ncbi:MAG TPA: formyltransferase family protein [Blastocatellia bacterium]|nr:formyltransferase family protein [Blastocatellia bacterium]
MNILLVGEESAGAQTLKLLANSDHRLVGVMASPTRKAVGGMTVWQHAEKLGCRTWPAESVKDPAFAEVIRAAEVDLLLNVHSLFVIKPEIVAAPRWGSFNLHPGPLPRYAGLNAPSWAIYRGERSHGVTLHRMLAGIDTGTIAYQTSFDIEEADTGFSLSAKCAKFGMELIRKLLETAAENPQAIPAIEQELDRREYFGKGTPEDGWLAWSRPALEIFNFVRAADYSPFPSPWRTPRSRLGNQEVAFVKTVLTGRACDAAPGTIDRSDGGQVWVAGADEWVEVGRLMVDGQYANASAVLRPGKRLEWGS